MLALDIKFSLRLSPQLYRFLVHSFGGGGAGAVGADGNSLAGGTGGTGVVIIRYVR